MYSTHTYTQIRGLYVCAVKNTIVTEALYGHKIPSILINNGINTVVHICIDNFYILYTDDYKKIHCVIVVAFISCSQMATMK